MNDWPARYGNPDQAADELQHILTAALARLDQHDRHKPEETGMGHCYGKDAA